MSPLRVKATTCYLTFSCLLWSLLSQLFHSQPPCLTSSPSLFPSYISSFLSFSPNMQIPSFRLTVETMPLIWSDFLNCKLLTGCHRERSHSPSCKFSLFSVEQLNYKLERTQSSAPNTKSVWCVDNSRQQALQGPTLSQPSILK